MALIVEMEFCRNPSSVPDAAMYEIIFLSSWAAEVALYTDKATWRDNLE